ncbi:hypothetical protein DM01DRAFT_1333210 [Hesseltinella vesiculosa]|uniref:GATA-type domain-containing protein n=1 Tax=Hesseltinella vesiculosa TaxID=101127 RepID=A0A1X2GRT5_9FUNG|nr:hypothetical protein DM01DRAFT_1333210 [Hesseltinella vesiculosa]
MSASSRNESHPMPDKRPTLPPISSMDGYLRERAASSPIQPSLPTSPWTVSTPCPEDHPMTGHQHPSMLLPSPPTAPMPSSLPTTMPSFASIHPHHVPSNHAPRSSSNSSSSSSSSMDIPYTSASVPVPAMTMSSLYQRRDSSSLSHERRRSSQDPPSQRIEGDINEVLLQCHYLSDNMTQQKAMLLDQDYFSDSTNMRPWLDGMIGRANEVLNALLRLRKQQMASEIMKLHGGQDQVADSHQDLGQSEIITTTKLSGKMEGSFHTIRQKRRGRRAAFQGRCHSCNISETPEWRRGPDGARTLCNACGLHYAKLTRKKAESQKDTIKPMKRETYDVLVTDLSVNDQDPMRRSRRSLSQSTPSSSLSTSFHASSPK